MKIRNGFVSNSSSSSFVVAFPEFPMNARHVKKMMFGEQNSLEYETYKTKIISKNTEKFEYKGQTCYFDKTETEILKRSMSTLKIAKRIYKDMETQVANDQKNIFDAFEKRSMFMKFEEANQKIIKEFIDSTENKYIYTFNYGSWGDELHQFIAIHKVFRNLPHKTISHYIMDYFTNQEVIK